MAECRTCGATFHLGDPHDCPGPPSGRYLLLDVVIALVAGSVVGGVVGMPLVQITDPSAQPVCTAVSIAATFLLMRAARRSRPRANTPRE